MDVAVAGLWLAALACIFRWRQLIGSRTWLLLACAVLVVFYLAMPWQWGSTSDADSRVLPALLVCLLAWFGRMPLKWFGLAVGLLGLALVLHFGDVLISWHRLDSRLSVAEVAFDHIPPGSRIMPVNMSTMSKVDLEPHFVCWAVVLNDSYVPSLFAYRDQQPLELKPSTKIWARMEEGVLEFDEGGTRANYDFVWLYNPQETPARIPPSFTQVFAANGLTLWRVRH